VRGPTRERARHATEKANGHSWARRGSGRGRNGGGGGYGGDCRCGRIGGGHNGEDGGIGATTWDGIDHTDGDGSSSGKIAGRDVDAELGRREGTDGPLRAVPTHLRLGTETRAIDYQRKRAGACWGGVGRKAGDDGGRIVDGKRLWRRNTTARSRIEDCDVEGSSVGEIGGGKGSRELIGADVGRGAGRAIPLNRRASHKVGAGDGDCLGGRARSSGVGADPREDGAGRGDIDLYALNGGQRTVECGEGKGSRIIDGDGEIARGREMGRRRKARACELNIGTFAGDLPGNFNGVRFGTAGGHGAGVGSERDDGRRAGGGVDDDLLNQTHGRGAIGGGEGVGSGLIG